MADIKNLKSLSGEDFSFRVEHDEDVSVLAAGYIITPAGEFVNVLDSEDHSSIFNSYLRGYLGLADREEEDSIHATISLTELNHIVYYGVKISDGNKVTSDGLGVLVCPNDLSLLTNEQRSACLKLFRTNKSVFGTGKKIDLEVHNFIDQEFTEEELTTCFEEELNSSHKRI